MTIPGVRNLGSVTGFSSVGRKVKFCIIEAKNSDIRFRARTSPGQTRLPAPNGSNLQNQELVTNSKQIKSDSNVSRVPHET